MVFVGFWFVFFPQLDSSFTGFVFIRGIMDKIAVHCMAA